MADDDNGGDDDQDGGDLVPLTMKVQSECIASMSYSKSEGMVYFTFVRGTKQYSAPMSRQQATAWSQSDSPGEYFNENIKGKFAFGG